MYPSFLYPLVANLKPFHPGAPLAPPLDTKAHQSANDVVVRRTIAGGSPRLSPMLNKGKNHRCPFPMLRPCFCDPYSFVAHGLFPAHDFRHLICGLESNRPGLSILQKANLNPNLKAMLSRLGVPEAGRFLSAVFDVALLRSW